MTKTSISVGDLVTVNSDLRSSVWVYDVLPEMWAARVVQYQAPTQEPSKLLVGELAVCIAVIGCDHSSLYIVTPKSAGYVSTAFITKISIPEIINDYDE